MGIIRNNPGKTAVLALVIVVCIAVLVILFKGSASKPDTAVSDIHYDAVNVLIGLQAGSDTVDSFISSYGDQLTDSFKEGLTGYRDFLKEKDNGHFNLEEYYDSVYLDAARDESKEFISSPVVDDVPDDRPSNPSNTTAEEFVEDTRIHHENGETFMYLKDFDFSMDNSDIVAYNDTYMIVPKTAVPESYTSMSKDPNNVYKIKSIDSRATQNVKKGDLSKVEYESVIVSVLTGVPRKVKISADVEGKLLTFEVK